MTQETKHHRISSDRTTAVSTTTHYLPMYSCPIAKKVILLGAGGVATVAQWDGKDQFWHGWHPLPRRAVDETPTGGGLEQG